MLGIEQPSLDALNAKQKPQLLTSKVSEKNQEKLPKNTVFGQSGKKDHFFKEVFLDFLGTILSYELKFLALRSVHQLTSFELSKTVFGQFFIIKDVGGAQKLSDVGKKV